MNLIYDLPVVEDIIEGVVDTLRETGTIDHVSYLSGKSTIISVNFLSVGDIIEIDNKSYKVLEVGIGGIPFNIPHLIPGSGSYFKVKGDVTGQTSWKSCAPYFMDGHLMEVSMRLAEKDESVGNYKYKKYPLIILLQDHTMTKSNGPKADIDLDFVIVDGTNMNYETKDRREKKFKTILDPLYSIFIEALDKTLGIDILSEEWEVIRRYYWGSELNNKNIFSDHLDAIEVSNIKVQTNLKC